MTDAKRLHAREQREARAEDAAYEVAAFYRALRARGLPARAAQALAEAYTAAMMEDATPPEPWQT